MTKPFSHKTLTLRTIGYFLLVYAVCLVMFTYIGWSMSAHEAARRTICGSIFQRKDAKPNPTLLKDYFCTPILNYKKGLLDYCKALTNTWRKTL